MIREAVNTLRNANYKAVDARYNESTAPEILGFSTTSAAWSDVQLFKNLQCLHYQMSEGDVFESEIYNRLDTLIKELALCIVGNTAEYDEAQWGG